MSNQDAKSQRTHAPAAGLLPKRAGQPVKALVHIYFAELREMDRDGVLQDTWIAEYPARWAARRGAASVGTRLARSSAAAAIRPAPGDMPWSGCG